MPFVLSIDQSTSGTKGLIFDTKGNLVARHDLPHRQITNEAGWVEHDPLEIYENTLKAVKAVLKKSGLDAGQIAAAGISNQRETALAWDRGTGLPVYNAVVWQCGRAAPICEALSGAAPMVRERTGLNLSPFFSAAKLAWIIQNVPEAKQKLKAGSLCCGTVDSWLLFKLTGGETFKTDYSNASRTQLFNINTLDWDDDLLALFGLTRDALPEVCFSDSLFAESDFGGIIPHKIPVCGMLGDSHAALLGQACTHPGMAKATYGTGSSVMLNVGSNKIEPGPGVVASLAWGLNKTVSYVLEGNINYAGAVIKWLVEDIGLLENTREAAGIAASIDSANGVYLVPAFTGLGAPYWNNSARAILCGMNRTTKRAHIIRAAEECIAYQIKDIVDAMNSSSGSALKGIHADGGLTNDAFLMQFQSDIMEIPVKISGIEELSGAGAAYAAAISAGLSEFDDIIIERSAKTYMPVMPGSTRRLLYDGWKKAVGLIIK